MPTPTGAKADHRLPLKPSQIEAARPRTGRGSRRGRGESRRRPLPARSAGVDRRRSRDDLSSHRGSSVVIAGEGQPAGRPRARARDERRARQRGRTVSLHRAGRDAGRSISCSRSASSPRRWPPGQVDTLLVLGGNPVYTAPADLRFAEQLNKVALRVHLGLYANETSALCHWHIPEAHYLEAWSDARAFDGTASIVQPLIAPLYGGRSAHEVLAALERSAPNDRAYELVREHWQRQRRRRSRRSRRFWRRGAARRRRSRRHARCRRRTMRAAAADSPTFSRSRLRRHRRAGIEIVFRPDPTICDGRFANNGWLQELPKPLTKLTWDNAVLVEPGDERDGSA